MVLGSSIRIGPVPPMISASDRRSQVDAGSPLEGPIHQLHQVDEGDAPGVATFQAKQRNDALALKRLNHRSSGAARTREVVGTTDCTEGQMHRCNVLATLSQGVLRGFECLTAGGTPPQSVHRDLFGQRADFRGPARCADRPRNRLGILVLLERFRVAHARLRYRGEQSRAVPN